MFFQLKNDNVHKFKCVSEFLKSPFFVIQVTQYSCDFVNLAPEGCVQYYFGSTTGNVQNYNYNEGNGVHLANQDQTICVRYIIKGRFFSIFSDNLLTRIVGQIVNSCSKNPLDPSCNYFIVFIIYDFLFEIIQIFVPIH